MRVGLIQFENRVDLNKGVRATGFPAFVPLFLERNREVAKKVGWGYHLGGDAALKSHIKIKGPHHPIWSKVFFLNRFAEHYDALIWLDSDAVIHNSARFNYLLQRPEDFIYAPDPPAYRGIINTGVLIIKKPAFCFLRAWQSAFYKPDLMKLLKMPYYHSWLQEQNVAGQLLLYAPTPPSIELPLPHNPYFKKCSHRWGFHKRSELKGTPPFLDDVHKEALSIKRLQVPWYSFHASPEILDGLHHLSSTHEAYQSLLSPNGVLNINAVKSRVGSFHILGKAVNFKKYLKEHSLRDV